MKHAKGWVSTPQPHYHCTLVYKTCQTHSIHSIKSLSLSLQCPQHYKLKLAGYQQVQTTAASWKGVYLPWHGLDESCRPRLFSAVPTLLTSVAMMHSSFSSDMTYTDWYFVSFEVEYTESGRFLSEVSLLKAKRERTGQMAVALCYL